MLAHPQAGKWATRFLAMEPLLVRLAQTAQSFMTLETMMAMRVHALHTKVG